MNIAHPAHNSSRGRVCQKTVAPSTQNVIQRVTSHMLPTTVFVLVALWPLRIVGHRVVSALRAEDGRLTVELEPLGSSGAVLGALEGLRVRVRSLEVEDSGERRLVSVRAELDEAGQSGEVLDALQGLDDVRRVEWEP